MTVTRTVTAQATSTFTVTPQDTPVVLVLYNGESIPFPNPARINEGLRIRFNINRSADSVMFDMFTVSQRRIRKFDLARADIINMLNAGDNDIVIDSSELEGLSAGIYYYYITVGTGSQKVKSKVNKIIIMK